METGDGGNGGGVEGGPGSDLSDIPPEMLSVCVADMDVELTD